MRNKLRLYEAAANFEGNSPLRVGEKNTHYVGSDSEGRMAMVYINSHRAYVSGKTEEEARQYFEREIKKLAKKDKNVKEIEIIELYEVRIPGFEICLTSIEQKVRSK